MAFGDRLRELRDEKGITQKDLSKVLNISARVIGYYESNNRFPKDENTLKIIADYFNVSLDYLVGRTDIKLPPKTILSENNADYCLSLEGLPDEAIKKVDDYIELLRLKYESNDKNKKYL